LNRKPGYIKSEKSLEVFDKEIDNSRSSGDIFRTAPVGLAIVRDRKFVDVNDKFCDMLGYSADQLIGQYTKNCYFDEAEFLRAGQEIYDQIRDHGSAECEAKALCKDGSILDVVILSAPHITSGLDDSFIFAVLDITERKQAEEEARRARSFTDNLIQTSNAIIVVLDASGEIQLFNPAAEALTGYTKADLEGRNWFEVLAPAERYPYVHEEFRRLLEKGVPKLFENPILTKDGRERVIAWSNNQIIQNDKVMGTISFGIDITDRRRTENMLRSLVEGTAKSTGRGFFRKFVRHLAQALNCKYALVGVISSPEQKQIKTLSLWEGDKIGQNFIHDMSGSPCERISKGEMCLYNENVRDLFPKNTWLADHEVESYLGLPLLGSNDEPIGVIAAMNTKPLPKNMIEGAQTLMTIFASRAAAELKRIHAEDQIRALANRLRGEQQALYEKHAALKQVLEHMEKEKMGFRQEISSNMAQALYPFLKKLRGRGTLSKRDMVLFENIVKSITGKEIDIFKANYAKLTSRELDICELIKAGKTSQEIADSLFLSLQTIQKHRSSIRQKLQIKNREINLSAYLRNK